MEMYGFIIPNNCPKCGAPMRRFDSDYGDLLCTGCGAGYQYSGYSDCKHPKPNQKKYWEPVAIPVKSDVI